MPRRKRSWQGDRIVRRGWRHRDIIRFHEICKAGFHYTTGNHTSIVFGVFTVAFLRSDLKCDRLGAV